MRKLIQIIKSIKLKQVLTVFLAGSLLIVSTACSKGNVAQAGGKAYTDTAKRALSDTYDDYDANQPFEGGINGYNDDPRYDSGTSPKAKALVDQAKRQQKDSIGEYLGDVTNRALEGNKEATKKIPRAIEDTKEDITEDISQRTKTLKKNLNNAPDEAKKIFEGAKGTAQGAIDDATKASTNTAKEIKGNVKDLT